MINLLGLHSTSPAAVGGLADVPRRAFERARRALHSRKRRREFLKYHTLSLRALEHALPRSKVERQRAELLPRPVVS
jgi:hypothetical protein